MRSYKAADFPTAPTFIRAYAEGFQRNYPHHDLEIKPKTQRDRSVRYQIIINGDRGDFPLSEEQMRSATRGFNAGRG